MQLGGGRIGLDVAGTWFESCHPAVGTPKLNIVYPSFFKKERKRDFQPSVRDDILETWDCR